MSVIPVVYYFKELIILLKMTLVGSAISHKKLSEHDSVNQVLIAKIEPTKCKCPKHCQSFAYQHLRTHT
jgi:hypothetical protein